MSMKQFLSIGLLALSSYAIAQNQEKKMGLCPFNPSSTPSKLDVVGKSNKEWWPNALNLAILKQQDKKSNPMDEQFSYKSAFAKLDYFALKKDINELLRKVKIGGPQILAIMALSLFAWHGIAQVHIELAMEEAVPDLVWNVLHHKIHGRIMLT